MSGTCHFPADEISGIYAYYSPSDSNYENICQLFDTIHTCHKEKKPYYFVKLKALFFSFFYEMLMGNYIIPADKEQNKSLASIKKILELY